ncbi:MAG: RNA-binding protein, partial [Mizugakiibacter sp.]
MAAEPVGAVRADLWLWAARFFRTRALAKQAIAGG